MKTWNTPKIIELDITETANGIWPTTEEIWIITNDFFADKEPTTPPSDPTEDPVEQHS